MTEHSDMEKEKLLPIMNAWLSKGYDVYVKWTCPQCGERAAANEPNTFNDGGYIHEEKLDGSPCGVLYHGPVYGLLATWSRAKV